MGPWARLLHGFLCSPNSWLKLAQLSRHPQFRSAQHAVTLQTTPHPWLPSPPPCQGKAVVPLHEVQRRRRLRGSWALQDAPPGASLTMELSWTAAAGMY